VAALHALDKSRELQQGELLDQIDRLCDRQALASFDQHQ
jgi:hypothetical protein